MFGLPLANADRHQVGQQLAVPVYLDTPLVDRNSLDWLTIDLAELEVVMAAAAAPSSSTTATVRSLVSAVESRWLACPLSQKYSLKECLTIHAYSAVFRQACAQFGVSTAVTTTTTYTADYLRRFSLLQQLVQLASQLRLDAQRLTNHKYIAHQLALLYQCMATSSAAFGGDSVVMAFRQQIEDRFDTIKAATHQKSSSTMAADTANGDAVQQPRSLLPPQLSTEQKAWLVQLCTDILNHVSQLQPAIAGPAITHVGEHFFKSAEQQDELEALRAIYADDFEELGTGVYRIAVKADITGEDEDAPSLIMQFKFPPKYPQCEPELSLLEPTSSLLEDDQEVVNSLLDRVITRASESLGTQMIFDLVSFLQEELQQLRSNAAVAEERERQDRLERAEREEQAKYEGTPVNAETFNKWLAGHREKLRKRRLQELAASGVVKRDDRPTGKMLFERDASLVSSDAALLTEADVAVDTALFADELDDLDIGDDDDVGNDELTAQAQRLLLSGGGEDE